MFTEHDEARAIIDDPPVMEEVVEHTSTDTGIEQAISTSRAGTLQ